MCVGDVERETPNRPDREIVRQSDESERQIEDEKETSGNRQIERHKEKESERELER